MKASELRIGNLIAMNLAEFPENFFLVMEVADHAMMVTDEWNRKPSIRTGHDYYDVEQMEGIPITEDWLKLFGFKDIGHASTAHDGYFTYNVTEHLLLICGLMKWEFAFKTGGQILNVPTPQIKYVHELQNMVFAMSGKELKLKD